MKEVWLVGVGQWSDYHEKAVFSTKEKADSYALLYNGYVHSMIVDECDNLNPDNLTIFTVRMDSDGVHSSVRPQDNDYYGVPLNGKQIDFISGKLKLIGDEYYIDYNTDYFEANDTYVMEIHLMAKDSESAIKIANETRLNLIATNHWGFLKYTPVFDPERWKDYLEDKEYEKAKELN